jgi:hypothetical protein
MRSQKQTKMCRHRSSGQNPGVKSNRIYKTGNPTVFDNSRVKEGAQIGEKISLADGQKSK